MKKLILLLAVFCLICCKQGLKQTIIPAKISVNKNHMLQIVFTGSPPTNLEKLLFYKKDSVEKQIDKLYQFNVGDTILIDYQLQPKTEYTFLGFPPAGGLEFFHLKEEYFWVDLTADTLILNHPEDTTHKKRTY